MEEKKKKLKQVGRYSETEREIIKSIFAEDDDLLILVRRFFIQDTLTEEEKGQLLKLFPKDSPSLAVLRKTFYPEIIPDTPLHQMVDLWLINELEFKEKDPAFAWPYILSNTMFMNYLLNQFNFFEGKEILGTKFKDFTSIDIVAANQELIFCNLHARNRLISFIDSQLNQLKVLAGFKDETIEKTMERLMKDSSK